MPLRIKLVLGFMTVWGVVYAFIALSGDYALVPAPGSSRSEVSGIDAFFIHFNAANALLIFLIYTFIVLGLRSMPVARRTLWVAGFAFFYPIALPAFWWLHIWRAPRVAPPASGEDSSGREDDAGNR